jgi:Asp-tRNA(Asn)/Glu-tRNA(Gln) amidotransferase A subunit family amidase
VSIHRLTLKQGLAEVRAHRLTFAAWGDACRARIAAREPSVHAWAALNASPLTGAPVGVKDVIDTASLKTGLGNPAFVDRQPKLDAACIASLRAANFDVLGKTITAEFATYQPGPTANPHNVNHTPGGSSSGSAAAVADFHVPFAFGTQTAGSIIRPASFCGVLGFKPSFGRYSSHGMLTTAPHLDTLGGFARSVEDLALIDDILAVGDSVEQRIPRIGLCETPVWSHASAAMKAATHAVADRFRAIGHDVRAVTLPPIFSELIDAQTLLHCRESADCLGDIRDQYSVSDVFKSFIDKGRQQSDTAYYAALSTQRASVAALAKVFSEVDLLLTPGAPGSAPAGLAVTGDPIFSRIWTACGAPCLGFPAQADDNGLPLGVQLVANRNKDRFLLHWAAPLIEDGSVWKSRIE